MSTPVAKKQRSWSLVLPRVGALRLFLADQQAATWKKALLVLVLFYVLLPVDFIPDLIPVWGWLDDLGATFGASLFLAWVLAPYEPMRAAQKLEEKRFSNVRRDL